MARPVALRPQATPLGLCFQLCKTGQKRVELGLRQNLPGLTDATVLKTPQLLLPWNLSLCPALRRLLQAVTRASPDPPRSRQWPCQALGHPARLAPRGRAGPHQLAGRDGRNRMGNGSPSPHEHVADIRLHRGRIYVVCVTRTPKCLLWGTLKSGSGPCPCRHVSVRGARCLNQGCRQQNHSSH